MMFWFTIRAAVWDMQHDFCIFLVRLSSRGFESGARLDTLWTFAATRNNAENTRLWICDKEGSTGSRDLGEFEKSRLGSRKSRVRKTWGKPEENLRNLFFLWLLSGGIDKAGCWIATWCASAWSRTRCVVCPCSVSFQLDHGCKPCATWSKASLELMLGFSCLGLLCCFQTCHIMHFCLRCQCREVRDALLSSAEAWHVKHKQIVTAC